MKLTRTLFVVFKLILVILFVYTGMSKLIGHQKFLDQLSQVPVLQSIDLFVSFAIPLLEIVIAFALAFYKTELKGWWLSAILMSLFTLYVALMIAFADHLPCSCGGIIAALNWKHHLLLNAVLAILCWFRLYHFYFIERFSMHTKGVS